MEPWPPPAAARAVSIAASFALRTLDTARRPHGEKRQHDGHAHHDGELEQVGDEHAPQAREGRDIEVSAVIPKTMRRACSLVMPKIIMRIFTIARLTQPMMMQLMGTPR